MAPFQHIRHSLVANMDVVGLPMCRHNNKIVCWSEDRNKIPHRIAVHFPSAHACVNVAYFALWLWGFREALGRCITEICQAGHCNQKH